MSDRGSLELVDVWCSDERGAELQGLSLVVGPGEVMVVVGPPGSGKSMLVELIHGKRRPHRGIVRAGDPAVLAVDQPLKDLDRQAREAMWKFWWGLAKVGKSVLLTSDEDDLSDGMPSVVAFLSPKVAARGDILSPPADGLGHRSSLTPFPRGHSSLSNGVLRARGDGRSVRHARCNVQSGEKRELVFHERGVETPGVIPGACEGRNAVPASIPIPRA